MFSTDVYSAVRRMDEYKNIAESNAKLSSKCQSTVKKSFLAKLVGLMSV